MTGWGAWRAATFALFAIVSAAVPSPLVAQDVACDVGEQEVRELEFRGNRAVSDDDLAVRVATTPSSWWRRRLGLPWAERRCLDRTQLPQDLERIKRYYRTRGFHRAEVDTVVQQAGSNAVRVAFLINEGPPIIVRSYAVTGLDSVPGRDAVVRDLRLRVGAPFDFDLFTADIDTIVRRLRDVGYYRAEVLHEYRTNIDSLSADIANTVVPGTRARFGQPQFDVDTVPGRGQQISNAVVRRVMRISPGDFYSDRAIVEAQRNLFQLGTYRHVEVAPLPDSSQTFGDSVVVLRVRLTEDYMKRMDAEFGWATLDCGRVRLQYTDLNLWHAARRLELTAQASKIGYGRPVQTEHTREMCTLGGNSPLKDDERFSDKLHYFTGMSLRQPRLLGTRWVPTMSLYSERRGEHLAYLRETFVGADVSATRDLRDRTPLRLAYNLEYGRTDAQDAVLCALFNRCDELSRSQVRQEATLGVVSLALARLGMDNPISPTRGYFARGEVRSSASSILGTSPDLFFNKASGDLGWYRPIGSSVLALRLRGGTVVGRRRSPTDTVPFVPPQERLYAGGATSVRGFQQNELGELVYITSDSTQVQLDSTLSGPDYVYRYQMVAGSRPQRSVPLGGNSLFVANLDYRIRSPFISDRIFFTFFVDGGDVWNRGSPPKIKLTPGLGVRVLTPVGPIQVNAGFNPYQRVPGVVFFNKPGETRPGGVFLEPQLYCASPGNSITLSRRPSDGLLVANNAGCDGSFTPPRRVKLYEKLTFTFSIGSDF